MNARRERYLEEMGLGPVWRLRDRIRESTEPSERPPETSVRVKPAHSAAGPEATSDSDDRVRIGPSWKARLLPEFSQPYMRDLREFLKEEISARKVIYPRGSEYFAALDHTPFDKVKVVILGQDPYHGPNQAHGLCFSVRPGVDVPPSLQNIFIELKDDLGIETDAVIEVLNREREGLVFVLWGSYAQKKGAFIDTGKHLVLKGPHPSPLSAHRGFFGCRHFSRINNYLQAHGKTPIDWRLPKLDA